MLLQNGHILPLSCIQQSARSHSTVTVAQDCGAAKFTRRKAEKRCRQVKQKKKTHLQRKSEGLESTTTRGLALSLRTAPAPSLHERGTGPRHRDARVSSTPLPESPQLRHSIARDNPDRRGLGCSLTQNAWLLKWIGGAAAGRGRRSEWFIFLLPNRQKSVFP